MTLQPLREVTWAHIGVASPPLPFLAPPFTQGPSRQSWPPVSKYSALLDGSLSPFFIDPTTVVEPGLSFPAAHRVA